MLCDPAANVFGVTLNERLGLHLKVAKLKAHGFVTLLHVAKQAGVGGVLTRSKADRESGTTRLGVTSAVATST